MIQKDTVVFQLEQDTRTVHLQKVFRRILARQIEPLNNLHAQRHVGKELLLDLALQLINIFFVNPLMADHIDPQQIFFLIVDTRETSTVSRSSAMPPSILKSGNTS